jgi:penicillin-binding protein 1B
MQWYIPMLNMIIITRFPPIPFFSFNLNQDALDSSITQELKKLERRKRSKNLETAAVVTRRDSGEIVALAGGKDSQGVGFNRALNAVRPIGSLIKPIVYLTALEYPEKYTLITPVSDTAIKIKAEKGNWWEPSI